MDAPLIVHYRKIGNSWGFYMPEPMRQALGLVPGDVLIIRFIGNKAIIGRMEPGRAMPLSQEEFDAAKSLESRTGR